MFEAILTALGYAAIAIGSYFSTRETNETNKELAAEQRQHDIDMVNMENEYNSPVEQSERMRAAGLNPSALGMQGGTSVTGNISASHRGYTLPAMQDPMLSASNGLLSFASAMNQGASAKETNSLLQARKDQIQAQTDNLKQNTIKLGLDSDCQRIVNKYADEYNKYAVAGARADVLVKRSVARLNEGQLKQVHQDLSMYKIKVSEALKGLELTQSEIDNNYLNLDWVSTKIMSEKAQTKLTETQTSKINAEIDLVYAQTGKTEAEIQNIDEETKKTRETLSYIIQQYEATIENIKSNTGWTDEQTFWYGFEVETRSLPSGSILGIKLDEYKTDHAWEAKRIRSSRQTSKNIGGYGSSF